MPFLRFSELRKLRNYEQVAAVCYRIRYGEIEFLLVQTRGRALWTFPKGGTERGLSHAQMAAIEAFEEAGVHGRIEESAFVSYVPAGARQNRKARALAYRKASPVSAHLCQVLRLVPPKEANRKRTWFPADNAKLRLGEGRSPRAAAEFARVIDAAVARIRALQSTYGVEPTENWAQDYRQWHPSQNDALQKVHFEAPADAYDRKRLPARIDATRRKTVPCEVVEFDAARELNPQFRLNRGVNAKALGTGQKNG